MSPFDTDLAVKLVANRAGLKVFTRPVLSVDAKLLPPAYMHLTPNYTKIRRDLLDGIEIPGAAMTTDVEFILSKETNADRSDQYEA